MCAFIFRSAHDVAFIAEICFEAISHGRNRYQGCVLQLHTSYMLNSSEVIYWDIYDYLHVKVIEKYVKGS